MQIECLQQDLISAILVAQKATVNKSTSPVYQYLYLEGIQDSLRVIATNQLQTIVTEIPAQVKEQGKLLLPISIFRDIIAKMPSVMITLSADDKCLMTVSYVNMKYVIQGMSAATFTFMDGIEEEQCFSIKTEQFKNLVRQTYFTASVEENKPTLNGILLRCKDGKLDVVTSDSYRLSLASDQLEESLNFEMIVPVKILFDVLHSAGEEEDVTHVSFNQKYIKIQIGKTILISGLINGNFINYENIIPKEYKTKMVCDRSVLLSILERAFLLSDRDTLYPVKFDISYSRLFITSNSKVGEAFEEIQVQTEGEPLVIAFNSKFFIEVLRNIEYDILSFEFTTSTRTCVIRPVENQNLIYLILPVRM